jgi:hypothetical protein
MSNNEIGGFARKYMQEHEGEDFPKSSTRERQLTAQALSLHVDFIDGRRAEGFAWPHYVGYEWEDEATEERLTILFGPRAVEVLGKNLTALIDDIREGRLNRIRELPGARRKQLEEGNLENEPIVRAINVYPHFRALLEEIKGEQDEHQTRQSRRA